MTHFKLSNHPRRGATLVETLISTAIALMLLIAIGLVYMSGLNTRGVVDAQQRMLYVDEFVFAALESETVSMQSITTPASGTGETLVFTDATMETVTVQKSGTDIVLTRGTNPAVTLNSLEIRVTSFQVARVSTDTPTVRVSVTYEVDSIRGRTIEHTNTYVLMGHYE